jgi:hypothetical protein
MTFSKWHLMFVEYHSDYCDSAVCLSAKHYNGECHSTYCIIMSVILFTSVMFSDVIWISFMLISVIFLYFILQNVNFSYVILLSVIFRISFCLVSFYLKFNHLLPFLQTSFSSFSHLLGVILLNAIMGNVSLLSIILFSVFLLNAIYHIKI